MNINLKQQGSTYAAFHYTFDVVAEVRSGLYSKSANNLFPGHLNPKLCHIITFRSWTEAGGSGGGGL